MNCALIHYSTDYVFDGTKTPDYFEQSTPNPLNIYGKTKLLGDLSILKTKPKWLYFKSILGVWK